MLFEILLRTLLRVGLQTLVSCLIGKATGSGQVDFLFKCLFDSFIAICCVCFYAPVGVEVTANPEW